MKKVIFSAIAMIAFVGSSLANTAEIQDQKLIVLVKSCEEQAMDYTDGISGTDMEVYHAYTAYLAACRANTGPKQLKKAN
jgi:hypothetical protein